MDDKLKEFAKWVLQQVFEGCDISGGDAQEKALKLGLLTEYEYSTKSGVFIDDLEDGDTAYKFSYLLTKGE